MMSQSSLSMVAEQISGMLVLEVPKGSPAQEAGLEPFLDLIVEVDGTAMDPDNQEFFAQKIRDAENRQCLLQVYSARSAITRQLRVVPKRWSGPGLFGATVQFNCIDPRGCFGIRVVDVHPSSPAANAGLVPYTDFLLGTDTSLFYDVDDVVKQVSESLNQEMLIHTYNIETKKVRTVHLTPQRDWGGRGCLGCDIDTGGPPPSDMPPPSYATTPMRAQPQLGPGPLQQHQMMQMQQQRLQQPPQQLQQQQMMQQRPPMQQQPSNWQERIPSQARTPGGARPHQSPPRKQRDDCVGWLWFGGQGRQCCGQEYTDAPTPAARR